MRALLSPAFGVAAILAMGAGASAHNFPAGMSEVQLYSTSDASSSTVAPRDVTPGQMVMIKGACVADKDTDDVQVVLALADPAEQRAGWHSLLVTDMEITDGNLRVRIPDMPQARNHVFRVRLFVGHDDPCICEAGSIRIG